MPHTALFFIVFLGCIGSVHAQSEESDIEVYAQKSKQYLEVNKDSARFYLDKYLMSARQQEDSLNLASAYKLTGIFNDIQGNYELSLNYYDSSRLLFEALHDQLGVANIIYNKAYLFQKTGKHEEAIQYFLESLALYESLGEHLNRGRTIVSIGNNYFRVEMYDKAQEKYHEAIEVFRENNLTAPLAMCYVGLGAIYNQTNKYDSAMLIYREALTVLDSSDDRGRSIILTNLGNVYSSLGNQEMAIANYADALQLKERIGDKRGMLIILNNLSDSHLQLGNVAVARKYAEQGYRHAEALNDILLIKDFSFKLFKIYKQEGQYKEALAFLEKHTTLKDSLTNVNRASALVELEEKYEDEVNENKIMALELSNKTSESQRNAVLFISGILFLAVVFVIIWLVNVRKYSRILAVKNEEITKALAEKEVLIKEVHHRVKNNLQTISSLLNLQSRYMDSETRQIVDEGRNRVKSMALIHQRLYQSDNLKGIKFTDYLQNLTQSLFASYNISENKVIFRSDIDPINLDVDTAIPIGLIINELIGNSLKYAFSNGQKGKLYVAFKEREGFLELIVEDDGVGLPAGFDLSTSNGFGMRLIQVLGEKLESTFDISSVNGVRISMSFKNYQLSMI